MLLGLVYCSGFLGDSMLRSLFLGAFAYRRRRELKQLVILIVVYLIVFSMLSELVSGLSGFLFFLAVILKWVLVGAAMVHLFRASCRLFARRPGLKKTINKAALNSTRDQLPMVVANEGEGPSNTGRLKTRGEKIYDKYRKD